MKKNGFLAIFLTVSALVGAITSSNVNANDFMIGPIKHGMRGERLQTIVRCKTINKSGSYVVAANLIASGNCLVIRTDSVTLDLGGFLLSGDGTGSGITVETKTPGVALQDIVVRNGAVTGFETGIDLTATRGAILEGVRARENAGDGIDVGFSLVTHCVAIANGGDGIACTGGSCLISNSIVDGNGDDGIAATSTSSVTDCISQSNRGDGIQASGSGSTVTGNTVGNNQGNGISVVCPANVIGNLATNSGGDNLKLHFPGDCNVDNNVAP